MSARPVVVGTDGSEESLRAVDWATHVAARRALPLRIITVTAAPDRPPGRPGAPLTSDDLLRNVYADALHTTAGHAAGMAPGLAIETELLSGPPGRILAADASAAAMLVVAASGVGGYGERSAGPVSRYVADHAACPVVVFRDHGAAVYGEVVAGVEDPEDSAGVLEFAFAEAALRGARLRAVHAWHWASALPWPAHPHAAHGQHEKRRGGVLTATMHRPDSRGQSSQTAARLAEVLNAWRQKYPRVPVSPMVMHGQPGKVLASFSGHADLTVIGRRPHASWHASHSPTLHALLNHAEGSVAVIPSA